MQKCDQSQSHSVITVVVVTGDANRSRRGVDNSSLAIVLVAIKAIRERQLRAITPVGVRCSRSTLLAIHPPLVVGGGVFAFDSFVRSLGAKGKLNNLLALE